MKSCFVLMPLIEEFEPIYRDAILPAVRAALGERCKCEKADDQRRPGMITEKIVHSILNTDLVIALVADPREGNCVNPNVMYELGIAHSFRKPSIVVANSSRELPFDVRDVETILLDFTRFRGERTEFLSELRAQLRHSLELPGGIAELDKASPPRNPVTAHLGDTRIFIEDLPWLWGYCDVFKREREAETVWEITRDLYWPSEPLFFETVKEAIRQRQKHYFLVPKDDGIRRKSEAIYKELEQTGLPSDEIQKLLHFVTIEPNYFVLWPLAIVLYDADYATRRGGIICEPMKSEVGNDPFDDEIRELFGQHMKSGELGGFQQCLDSFSWIQRRKEATFDIRLDGRVVEALATSFARIWNEKIREEAREKSSEQEQASLLETWLIRG